MEVKPRFLAIAVGAVAIPLIREDDAAAIREQLVEPAKQVVLIH